MSNRIVVGLIVLAAVIEGLAPDLVPKNLLPLALVVLGLVYAGMAIDAEDATAYLVVVLAVGAAAQADVLGEIHVIGSSLDGIVDAISVALYSGVITVLVMRTLNRLKG